jgi:hypothetical protein
MRKKLQDVIEDNQKAGYHFFDKETMSFFHSRIETGLLRNKYFITSEMSGWQSTERAYTIRKAEADGSIKTIGEFRQYKKLEDATDEVYNIQEEL